VEITHNVSATISIDKKRMYDDKMNGKHLLNGCGKTEKYNGLSVLDYDGGTYVQTFEDITEEEYNKLSVNLKL
jgi:hypothetical protein